MNETLIKPKYRVRLNSAEKIEELLQEIYDQACRQLKEIQNEIDKLITSTTLGRDDFTMDDKAKYFKAMHDLTGDKKQAISAKFEIAKFMGEMLKHNGDAAAVVNDKNFSKRTSLRLDDIRAAINEGGDDSTTYNLKKN